MNPPRRRKGPLVKAVEISIAAPQVIALRTARLAAAGIRADPEFLRMGTEKIQAVQDGASAMALQIFRSNVEWAQLAARQWWWFWQNAWRWYPFSPISAPRAAPRELRRSITAAIDKGLAPAHRRVRSNLRRLSRAKKR